MAQQHTSSIPNVKAALVTTIRAALLTAGPGAKPVPVQYGESNETVDEEVVVGETMNTGEQAWGPLGARKREEDYTLAVYIDTSAWKTQQESTERAFALLALVEASLRADLRAGITGAAPITFERLELEVSQIAFSESPQPDGRGYETRIGFGVHAITRI